MVEEVLSDKAKLERIGRFVTQHFKLKQCCRYEKVDFQQEKSFNNRFFQSDDCACGRSFDWHASRNLTSVEEGAAEKRRYWSSEFDTQPCACNTFGKLLFAPGKGFDASTITPGAAAYYIRLTPDTSTQMDNIYALMTANNLWNLPTPQLIIEVAGMTRKMRIGDQENLNRFTSGLIKAAETSKAWIVTSGTNTGIMGIVGDALSKYRMTHSESNIICLGITSWGIVNNRESLIINENPTPPSTPGRVNVAVDLEQPDIIEMAGYLHQPSYISPNLTPLYPVDRAEKCKNGISLNSGHNSFIFIDNGRENRFNEEIAFRAKFLHYLSQKTLRGTSSHRVAVPLVLLVAGGGSSTLKTVEASIVHRAAHAGDDYMSDEGDERTAEIVNQKLNWSRPAVILSHFGGVSDLLAFAYEITAPPVDKDSLPSPYDEISCFPSDFDDRLKRHPAFGRILQFVPEHLKEEEAAMAIERLRNCLKYRHMLSVVDLGGGPDGTSFIPLDHAILDAIVKCNYGSATSTFELALLWNRADVAKELLLRDEAEISQHVDMKAALTKSITKGQTDFFKLLIENDLVDLNAYLTLYQLKLFYVDILLRRRGEAGKATCVWLFRSLLLNQTTDEETLSDMRPTLLRHIGSIIADLLGCLVENTFAHEKGLREIDLSQLKPYYTNMRDFFLLQLLLNHEQIAFEVWKRGHDHIGTALMAAVFLKALSKAAKRFDMADLGSTYQECANDWEQRAINVLSSCYEQEPLTCWRLLTRSLLTWQGATLLEIAYSGDIKQFMEQPAVQSALMNFWMGQLATFTPQRMVYLALLPPLLPFLIFRLRFEKAVSSRLTRATTPQLAPPASPSTDHDDRTKKDPSLPSDVFLNATNRRDVKLTRAALVNYRQKEGRISVFTAIYFLFSSPIAKYAVHSVVNFVFLFIFSCLLLEGNQEERITTVEIVVWVCCIVSLLDVVRNVFGKDFLSLREQLYEFFLKPSILVEIVSLLLVIIAAILRIFAIGNVEFIFPHTIYSVAYVLHWVKSLRIFLVTQLVGPKVITLFNMVRDLAFFVLIYVILLLSFSIPIYALLYPDRHFFKPASYFDLMAVISYERMWNIFVVTMDDSRRVVEGTCSSPSNVTVGFLQANIVYKNCSVRNVFAIILYIIYLLLTNIMLLNMLIAMFAHTVDQTRISATRLWRFAMYSFLYEYYTRPVLPGPLMIFELVYRFVRFVHRRRTRSYTKSGPENTDLKHFYPNLDDFEYRRLEMFERSAIEANAVLFIKE